jgi:hypothetical protein
LPPIIIKDTRPENIQAYWLPCLAKTGLYLKAVAVETSIRVQLQPRWRESAVTEAGYPMVSPSACYLQFRWHQPSTGLKGMFNEIVLRWNRLNEKQQRVAWWEPVTTRKKWLTADGSVPDHRHTRTALGAFWSEKLEKRAACWD